VDSPQAPPPPLVLVDATTRLPSLGDSKHASASRNSSSAGSSVPLPASSRHLTSVNRALLYMMASRGGGGAPSDGARVTIAGNLLSLLPMLASVLLLLPLYNLLAFQPEQFKRVR
jgi:hypothetical protein